MSAPKTPAAGEPTPQDRLPELIAAVVDRLAQLALAKGRGSLPHKPALALPAQIGAGNVVPFPATPAPLQGALMMADRGFSVIRLKPGSKVPIVGPTEGTTDSKLIQTWWQAAPHLNFGYLLGADHVGLDFDLYKPGGREARAAFGDLPATLQVFTPGGGEHYVLKISRQIGQQKPAPTIDVRTGNGYLVCPGSIVGGKPYLIGNDAPPALCPPHVDGQLGKRPEPYNREAAWEAGTCGDWHSKIDAALWERIRTEGADRSIHCFQVLCDLFALGLTDDDVDELATEDGAFCAKYEDRGDLKDEIARVRREWRASRPPAAFGEVTPAPGTSPASLQAPAVKRMTPVRADMIAERQITWLRHPYFPADAISLIGSRGGTGKGLFMSAHAAPITKGSKWPLSDENAPKGRVFWAEAEDPADKVLIPRWRAAGVDRSMVDFVDLKTYALNDLKDYVHEHQPRMLVFSPFLSFLGDLTEPNNEVEVRKKLQAIQDAIEGTGCAAIGICHINKKADQVAIERLLGSVAFANYVRSALMLNIEDESTRQVRVVHSKFNWSPKGDDQLFTPRNIGPPRGQEICLDFERPESNVDSEAMYDRKKKDGKLSCPAWLEQYLKSNSRVPKERVLSDGEEAGYSEAAIVQAFKRHPRMRSKIEGFPGKAIWWVEPS